MVSSLPGQSYHTPGQPSALPEVEAGTRKGGSTGPSGPFPPTKGLSQKFPRPYNECLLRSVYWTHRRVGISLVPRKSALNVFAAMASSGPALRVSMFLGPISNCMHMS